LYPFNALFFALPDQMDLFTAIGKGIEFLRNIGRGIARALNTIATLANFLVGLPFRVANSVINAGRDILSGISAVQDAFDFSKLGKKLVNDVKNNARALRQLVDATFPGDPNLAGHDGSDGFVKNSLTNLVRNCNQLLSLDFVWQESKQIQVADYTEAYRSLTGEPPVTSGSPLNVENIRLPSSSVEEEILRGENIRQLAKRTTGNEANWKKIALINDLKAPYLAPSASDGVLPFGGKIIIPRESSDLDAESKVGAIVNTDADQQALSPILRQYGRDLKLASIGGTSPSVSDVEVNQRGDLAIIEGTPNVEQALNIKMSTEQGELATHSTFGAKYPIGSKFPGRVRVQEFSLNVQRTLRQDPRIREIKSIDIEADADVLSVKTKLALAGSDIKLPVSFVTRR
jgi:hypothetical protein